MSAFSSKKMLALAVAAPAVSTLFSENGVEGLKLNMNHVTAAQLAERKRRADQFEAAALARSQTARPRPVASLKKPQTAAQRIALRQLNAARLANAEPMRNDEPSSSRSGSNSKAGLDLPEDHVEAENQRLMDLAIKESLEAATATKVRDAGSDKLPAITKPLSNKEGKRPVPVPAKPVGSTSVAGSSGLTPAENEAAKIVDAAMQDAELSADQVEELKAAIYLSLEQPTEQLAEDVASAAGAAGPSSASSSSAPAVEQKVLALLQYPSEHQGTNDPNAALGSAFNIAGQPNDASGSSDSARAVAPPPALAPVGAEFPLEYRLASGHAASSSVTGADLLKNAFENAAREFEKISEDAEKARAAEREALREQRRIKEQEERAAAEQAAQVPEEDFRADIAAIEAATAARKAEDDEASRLEVNRLLREYDAEYAHHLAAEQHLWAAAEVPVAVPAY